MAQIQEAEEDEVTEQLVALFGPNYKRCVNGNITPKLMEGLKDVIRAIRYLYLTGHYEITYARVVGVIRNVFNGSITRGIQLKGVISAFPCVFTPESLKNKKITLTDKGKELLDIIVTDSAEIKPYMLQVKKKDDFTPALFNLASLIEFEEGYTEKTTLRIRSNIELFDENEDPVEIDDYLSGAVQKVRVEGDLKCIWKQCPHERINFSMTDIRLTEKHPHIRTLLEFLVSKIDEIDECYHSNIEDRKCRKYRNLNAVAYNEIKKLLLAVAARGKDLFRDDVELKIVKVGRNEIVTLLYFKKLDKMLCSKCLTTNCEHVRMARGEIV